MSFLPFFLRFSFVEISHGRASAQRRDSDTDLGIGNEFTMASLGQIAKLALGGNV